MDIKRLMKRALLTGALVSGMVFSENQVIGFEPAQVKDNQQHLSSMNSDEVVPSQLIAESGLSKAVSRDDLMEKKAYFVENTPPPTIIYSKLVPKEMAEHLMRDKKDLALGVKFVENGTDKITNIEAIFHTFVTAVGRVEMFGDPTYRNGHHAIVSFKNGETRQVLLSYLIQPDFEFKNVMMQLCAPKKSEMIGEPLDQYSQFPSAEEKADPVFRKNYDLKLLKHLIYHLASDHKLQALSEIRDEDKLEREEGIRWIARAILDEKVLKPWEGEPKYTLKGKYILLPSQWGRSSVCLSLEVLLNMYKEQLRVEFAALDREAAGSLYCYTDDPPSIFATAIGKEKGANILNMVKVLALKELLFQDRDFARYLKAYAFNDYADICTPSLLRHIFAARRIKVLPKRVLYLGQSGYYLGVSVDNPGLALVLHNNGDGFGQNIESEGASSLDGLIGTYSTAAFVVDRNRKDLLDKMAPLEGTSD